MSATHRCANCWVAQYQIKSDAACKNEWWATWDELNKTEAVLIG